MKSKIKLKKDSKAIPKSLGIKEASMQRDAEMFNNEIKMLETLQYDCAYFLSGMMVMDILEIEKHIIVNERNLSKGKKFTSKEEIENLKKKYAEMWVKVNNSVGEDFQTIYDDIKEGQNSVARESLDSSDGKCGFLHMVLPKFNKDGTHDPVGERNISWN